MLRSANDVKGYRIGATDGPIGTIRDLYFDDERWAVRDLEVDISNWVGWSARERIVEPALCVSRQAADGPPCALDSAAPERAVTVRSRSVTGDAKRVIGCKEGTSMEGLTHAQRLWLVKAAVYREVAHVYEAEQRQLADAIPHAVGRVTRGGLSTRQAEQLLADWRAQQPGLKVRRFPAPRRSLTQDARG